VPLRTGVSAMAALTGLVLAGGRSRRMGSDKALLTIGGGRLVDHAVEVLQACCGQVLVAAGNERRIDGLAVPQIADAVADVGPLGGILAGLEHARTPLLAVLAVDLPDADPAVLRLLADRWNAEMVVAPRIDGRLQPLHAVWATAAAPALGRLLQDGTRSVTAAAQMLGTSAVDAGACMAVASSPRFARNLNRPGDREGAAMNDWVQRYGAALGVEVDQPVRSALLELARVVAHGTERRNAPLATYVAGRYVTARVEQGVDARAAVAEAVDVAQGLLDEEPDA
jgi:molybdenum cofactor guanylyltransferase